MHVSGEFDHSLSVQSGSKSRAAIPVSLEWTRNKRGPGGGNEPGLQGLSDNQQDMALIGTVDPYVPNTSFSNYVEHFEYFFSVNAIADDKKKDLFIN